MKVEGESVVVNGTSYTKPQCLVKAGETVEFQAEWEAAFSKMDDVDQQVAALETQKEELKKYGKVREGWGYSYEETYDFSPENVKSFDVNRTSKGIEVLAVLNDGGVFFKSFLTNRYFWENIDDYAGIVSYAGGEELVKPTLTGAAEVDGPAVEAFQAKVRAGLDEAMEAVRVQAATIFAEGPEAEIGAEMQEAKAELLAAHPSLQYFFDNPMNPKVEETEKEAEGEKEEAS